MTKSLVELVTEYVAAHPDLTAREIALGVRSRLASVREVLSSEAFSATERGAYLADRAVVYRIALVAADRLGRAARRSQCDLIAAVLKDGRAHSVAEIHRRCGTSRLNSRVAELRKRRGMIIECRHIKGAGRGADAYEYQLLGYLEGFGPSEAADTLIGDAAAPGGESAASDGPGNQHDSPAGGLPCDGPSDEQLGLGEAA